MTRFFLGLALWALLLAFAACGGDGKGTDPARDAELAEMVDTVVSTYDDLTVCTDKREGTTAYVEDEKKAYVCENKRWTANDSLTESIQNKDSDSAKDAEPDENVDTVVPTFDDLPSCTRDHEGATAYVEDEDSAYVCKKGLWVVDDSLTKAIQRKNEKVAEKTSLSSQNDKSLSSSSDERKNFDENVFPEAIIPPPCKVETDANCFLDERDGQTYRTVKIGDQVWMAQNLNYAFLKISIDMDSSSFCYNDSVEYCAKYGRLYTWAAAQGETEDDCPPPNSCPSYLDSRDVCPVGWHLPSLNEWPPFGLATITDIDSAFGVLPAGFGTPAYGTPCDNNRQDFCFRYEGVSAYFWTATTYIKNYVQTPDVYIATYNYISPTGTIRNMGRLEALSVRCVKDSDSVAVQIQPSSSSVISTFPVALPCKTEAEDNCEYDTLKDDRDGQTYRTVKIGEQWWMAENLNYRYILQTDEEDSSSYCYGDDPANCSKYGRLYLWSAAMDGAGIVPGNTPSVCGSERTCNARTRRVRGVCPEGWHLPTVPEWRTLFIAVGGKEKVETKLNSTDGWNNDANGSDAFGFSALPAGNRNAQSSDFRNQGVNAYFWSSTEDDASHAYRMNLFGDKAEAFLGIISKRYAFSVRCLKD